MARVTVEDCITVIPNRFELCLVASNRAKNILSGSATSLDTKEKSSVIALREIADELVDISNIRKNITKEIKNQAIKEYQDSIGNSDGYLEEIENQSLVLKDNLFVEDNIQIDD